ncbi:MAG: hypothetical protein KDK09_05000 [Rhodobacteraceae bacterium]|nr:hypothetical protein [Paracoccaceae bacterium]
MRTLAIVLCLMLAVLGLPRAGGDASMAHVAGPSMAMAAGPVDCAPDRCAPDCVQCGMVSGCAAVAVEPQTCPLARRAPGLAPRPFDAPVVAQRALMPDPRPPRS